MGIDADAAAMAESSRRAAAPVSRGGLPNALFVVAAAEALPAGLAGAFDRVTVNLPWASLLRGALVIEGELSFAQRLQAILPMAEEASP